MFPPSGPLRLALFGVYVGIIELSDNFVSFFVFVGKGWGRIKLFGALAIRSVEGEREGEDIFWGLLEGSWYFVTNYNCTYNPNYIYIGALKGLISAVICTVIIGYQVP